MKNRYFKYIIPVCLVTIVSIEIYEYMRGHEFNLAQLVIVFALTPAAIDGFNPSFKEAAYYKYFKWLMVAVAFILLGIVLFNSM